MEVSSHALALGRVDGMTFDVAVFTNLSRGPPRLPRRPGGLLPGQGDAVHAASGPRRGVVDIDDAYGAPAGRGSATVPVTTVSPSGARRRLAGRGRSRSDRRGQHLHPGRAGRRAPRLRHPAARRLQRRQRRARRRGARRRPASTRPRRRPGCAACPGVPGRMERVDDGQGFLALVDYAHTPGRAGAAAGNGARAGRPAGGRLVVVLGCGGDRDRQQAPGDGGDRRARRRRRRAHQRQPALRGPGAILAAMRRGAEAALRDGAEAGSRSSPTAGRPSRLAVAARRPGRRRGGRRQGPRAGPGDRRRRCTRSTTASCCATALARGAGMIAD